MAHWTSFLGMGQGGRMFGKAATFNQPIMKWKSENVTTMELMSNFSGGYNSGGNSGQK